VKLSTPGHDKDEDEDGVIDTSKMKDDENETGGVASGADSSAWTYSPSDGKPDGPR
jgi:hypothetical protein